MGKQGFGLLLMVLRLSQICAQQDSCEQVMCRSCNFGTFREQCFQFICGPINSTQLK